MKKISYDTCAIKMTIIKCSKLTLVFVLIFKSECINTSQIVLYHSKTINASE